MAKASTERHDERRPTRHWEPAVETAPSAVAAEEPSLARTIGLIGACLVIFGGINLAMSLTGTREWLGLGRSAFLLSLGVVGLVFHSLFDRDLQIRRIYWGAGILLLAAGIVLSIVPGKEGTVGSLFGVGFPCLFLAPVFLLATLRNESNPDFRRLTTLILGGAGAAGAAVAFVMGNNFRGKEFLLPYGSLIALLSLLYLVGFVIERGIADDLGYRAALGMGLLGLAVILLGLFRSLIPASWEDLSATFAPWGVTYCLLGFLYLAVGLGLASDNKIVVMTRRDLASLFYSPAIYLIMVGLTLVGWVFYGNFVLIAIDRPLEEPILLRYFLGFGPVVGVLFLVPVQTMRLLTEERRSGSLEMMLTLPVSEAAVVVSKFLAAFILHMIMWLPWCLYLAALRVGGGTSFDFRPLYSFAIVVAFTGAAFVSMGLFFSSLTKDDLVSAVLTFAGMIGFVGIVFFRGMFERASPNSPLVPVLRHTDFIELWFQSLNGVLVPKYLLFYLSLTILNLFLTTKVLQARRWV